MKVDADGKTPYTSDFNWEEVKQKLEWTTDNLFEWFKNNHIKSKADKCQSLVTRDTDVTVKIGEFDVKNSKEEELLGVKKDCEFYFENYVSSLAKRPTKSYMHSQEL